MASKRLPVDARPGEEWRPVPMAAYYMVSNQGRLMRAAGTGRGIDKDRLLIPRTNDNGYHVAMLTMPDGGVRTTRIHRLVAAAFIGDITGAMVNHIDGNKTNNHVSNLEITDRAGNTEHAKRTGLYRSGARHGMAKLTDEQVRQIRTDFAAGIDGRTIAARYGISRNYAYNIKAGRERAAA